MDASSLTCLRLLALALSLVLAAGTAAAPGALEPPAGSGLEPLPRVASHVAFWFGWYGFYPQTEVNR